jgi:MFS family permease
VKSLLRFPDVVASGEPPALPVGSSVVLADADSLVVADAVGPDGADGADEAAGFGVRVRVAAADGVAFVVAAVAWVDAVLVGFGAPAGWEVFVGFGFLVGFGVGVLVGAAWAFVGDVAGRRRLVEFCQAKPRNPPLGTFVPATPAVA